MKKLLINVTYIFLHRPDMVRYTKDIASLNRRVLLSGQKGTQRVQRLLMEALAHEANAKLLVLDESIAEDLPASVARSKKDKRREVSSPLIVNLCILRLPMRAFTVGPIRR